MSQEQATCRVHVLLGPGPEVAKGCTWAACLHRGKSCHQNGAGCGPGDAAWAGQQHAYWPGVRPGPQWQKSCLHEHEM